MRYALASRFNDFKVKFKKHTHDILNKINSIKNIIVTKWVNKDNLKKASKNIKATAISASKKLEPVKDKAISIKDRVYSLKNIMWSKEYSRFYPGVTSERIWQAWTDIDSWSEWRSDIDYAELEYDFKVGEHFKLKPKGMPAVKVMLTEIKEPKSFTDCTEFLGAKMHNTHSIEVKDSGVTLLSKVEVRGVLTSLWVKLVAEQVANTAGDKMDSLVDFAKNKDYSK